MSVIRFWNAGAALAVVLGILSACAPIVRSHGYIPPEEDLALLTVGVDTRDTVAAAVGQPTAAGIITTSGYYYVRSRWETWGPRAPKEVDRQVLALSFSEAGVLENIERFTLADGQVVVLSRRITSTSIRNVSFIRQLLGNVGRFSVGQGEE